MRELTACGLVLLISVGLVGCSKRPAPTSSESTSVAAPAADAGAKAGSKGEDTTAIAKELEDKFQKGTLEGAFTPVGSELVMVKDDDTREVAALPEAIHKHGESATGLWAAPDQTLFAAGFMYTGVPGPDTGVVYRKDAAKEAPVTISYTRPGKELAFVWGRTATDVYAAGNEILVHWDGAAWTEIPLPGVDGLIRDIWGSDTDLWIITGKTNRSGRIYRRRGGAGDWKREAEVSVFLRAIYGAGNSVWAAGDDGVILRRGIDGFWPEVRRKEDTQIYHLWASSENDVYAVGVDLLNSKGKDVWSPISLPNDRLFGITGTSAQDVYALGVGAVFHGPATGNATWKKMPFDATACKTIVAMKGTLVCLREKREPVHLTPGGR